MAKISLDRFRLQFISHQNEKLGYLDGIREALAGGCKWIQLRMKRSYRRRSAPYRPTGEGMVQRTAGHASSSTTVWLSWKELQIDGVHPGKNDMPIAEARKILGDGFIIGGTANTFEDVKAHYEAGADYIGCGPFRFTTTKEKLSPILGLGRI